VIDLWRQNSVTLGQRVRIVTNRDTMEGVATDIRDNGALVLQLADGTEKTIVYGDCFHQ
jgi:BirA family biotin operon repressor/biotin-[acetyl-CoA-carboxylase] ligase